MSSDDLMRRVADTSKVLIFAGAGMSQELGTPTYWTGYNAQYASDKSEFGYTALEHSSAQLWESDLLSQLKYFGQAYADMIESQKDLESSSYGMLLNWLKRERREYFVVTSNVDSAFLNAGFDSERLYEVHGTYRNSQCLTWPYRHGVYETSQALSGTKCPICGGHSRPNVLFFYDESYNELQDQKNRYFNFWDECDDETLILEIGVGVTVPRIRELATRAYYTSDGTYIHINPIRHPWNTFLPQMFNKVPSVPEIWVQKKSQDGLRALGIS